MINEYDPGDIFDCETYEEIVAMEIAEMKRFNRTSTKQNSIYSLERTLSDYEMDIYL